MLDLWLTYLLVSGHRGIRMGRPAASQAAAEGRLHTQRLRAPVRSNLALETRAVLVLAVLLLFIVPNAMADTEQVSSPSIRSDARPRLARWSFFPDLWHDVRWFLFAKFHAD